MAQQGGGIGSQLQNSRGSRSQPQEMCPDPPGSGAKHMDPSATSQHANSPKTPSKTPCKNTVDDGVGFVYYDHGMSSIGTACTVTGAVIRAALIGAVLIGAVLRYVGRDRSLLRVPASMCRGLVMRTPQTEKVEWLPLRCRQPHRSPCQRYRLSCRFRTRPSRLAFACTKTNYSMICAGVRCN